MTIHTNTIQTATLPDGDEIRENLEDYRVRVSGGLGSDDVTDGETLIPIPMLASLYVDGTSEASDAEFYFYPQRSGRISYMFISSLGGDDAGNVFSIEVGGAEVFSTPAPGASGQSIAQQPNVEYEAGDRVLINIDHDGSGYWYSLYLERWEDGL